MGSLGNGTLEKRLFSVKAVNVLDKPEIIESGKAITPFYICPERLLRDNGNWSHLAENKDIVQLYSHTQDILNQRADFRDTIEVLAALVKYRAKLAGIPEDQLSTRVAVAGAKSKDWIFTGPVAQVLNLDYVTLHNGRDDVDILQRENRMDIVESCNDLSNYDLVIPVVDLVTEEDGGSSGLISKLRSNKAKVGDLVSLVSQAQGAEGKIKTDTGIEVHPLVTVDGSFFDRSKLSDSKKGVCIDYHSNPAEWTKNYLIENGSSIILDAILRDGQETRAYRLINEYRTLLEERDMFGYIEETLRYNGINLEDRLRDLR